jgi:uncharacterized protein (DUF488 family)
MKTSPSEAIHTILTIGHSTHMLDTFINLLQTHGVKHLIDVRTVPRSRRNPQFNKDTLPDSLNNAGIRYTHVSGLGGLRRPHPDSPNTGWRNLSFRGFADYMQTQEFEKNLLSLIEIARDEQITMMCAEALPWRCHRSLIADALSVRGIKVEHIMGTKNRQTHHLTPWAVVNGKNIIYPPESFQINHKT